MEINITIRMDRPGDGRLTEKLDEALKLLKEIKRMDAQTQDLLNQVNDATNKLGTNLGLLSTTVTDIGTVNGTIKTELEGLIAQVQAGATPADVVAGLQALALKSKAASDASDAVVTALQQQKSALDGIAAEGAPTVPVVPPPPVIPTPAAP